MAAGSKIIRAVLTDLENSNPNEALDRLVLFNDSEGLPINPDMLLSAPDIEFIESAARLQREGEAIYNDVRVSTPGVIGLRVDGTYIEGFTTVKPELDSPRDLRSLFTIYTDAPGDADQMTWAQIKQLQDEGHEIGNHTRYGVDPYSNEGYATAIDQMSNESLIANSIQVDRHDQSGNWTNEWNFDDAAKLESTAIGRWIRAHFMAMSGYLNDDLYGFSRVFPVINRFGGNHVTITDFTSATTAIDLIDRAIERHGYQQFLIHSNHIGTSGKLSLANFRTILDYIVTKRDAGLVTVLLPTAADFARRGANINYSADPAEWTDWRKSGVPILGAAGSAHSGGVNKATVLSGYPNNYYYKEIPANRLRTLMIEFWAWSSTGVNTTARLLLKHIAPGGVSPVYINRSLTWALTGSTPRLCRAFIRPGTEPGVVTITPFATSATDPPAYSDVVITKI